MRTLDASRSSYSGRNVHEDLAIHPNVPDSLSYADVAGFSLAIDELKQYGMHKNDFFEYQ